MSTQNMYLLRASKKEIQPGNMHLCYGASMINPMIQNLDPFLPRFDWGSRSAKSGCSKVALSGLDGMK